MECQLLRTDSRSLSVIGLGLKRVKTTVHSSSHMVPTVKVDCLCNGRCHKESAWRIHYVNDIVMECQL